MISKERIHLQQQEIHDYLGRFFSTTGCSTTIDNNSIHTTLTIEMDKLLMNRPFYWHYLEKTGGIPNPSKLSLTVDEPKDNMELVHFGSPRLKQIFDITTKLGSFIRLYQQTSNLNKQVPLYPYVMLNGTISYVCDLKKERLYSYGINLLTGEIIEDFFHKATSLPLGTKIPDYCFTLSPFITIKSGINRIQEKIKYELLNEEHAWSENAHKRWNHDLTLLNNFFEDEVELPEIYFIEKQALKNQYEPKIEINILNGGLIYLNDNR